MTAKMKYARMSPKKVRPLTRELKGRSASEALELLRFIPKKSARLFAKTLQSAIANAENNHNLSSDSLLVKQAIVEEGPSMRRYRPVAH